MSTKTNNTVAKTAEATVAEGLNVVKEVSAFDKKLGDLAKVLEDMAKPEKKERAKTYKKADVLRHPEAFIVLPEGMTFQAARNFLEKFEKDQEAWVSVNFDFPAFPLDGVRALMMALKAIYGFSQAVPTPSFWGDEPPTMINMPVSATENETVIWGRFKVPGLDGYLETGFGGEGVPTFTLYGSVRKREEFKVQQIAEMIRLVLANFSAYKGKAVQLDLTWMRENRGFNPSYHAPKFMNLTGPEEPLILSKASETLLETTILYRVQYPEACYAAKIPLKTGVLLAGEPGTGKTLTARKIARLCEENGWTFLYVLDARDFSRAMEFARLYEPAVVFIEDIDKVLESRDLTMNQLLNVLDGLDKSRKVACVFTTNYINSIEPVALRPGRIDGIIELGTVDLYAANKFLHMYGQGDNGASMLEDGADFSEALNMMVGMRPAFISNAVAKAKIVSAIRNIKISPKIMVEQLEAMQYHMALLDNLSGKPKPDIFAQALEAMAERLDVRQNVKAVVAATKLSGSNYRFEVDEAKANAK